MKLTTHDLTVYHKNRVGIQKASIEASQAQIVGFIGADGAGKSSTMHAIAGVIRFEGEVCLEEFCYHSPKEAEKIKDRLGLMPQGLGLVLYPDLSVAEHLDFFSDIRGLKRDETYKRYRERLLHMAGLAQFQERLAKHLSGGMKQKLSLICTLIHRPRLLLLDEPTTGVDPLSRQELWEILDENRSNSITLVSTAYMSEASKMDRIYLFDDQQIIAEGSVEELLQSARSFTYQETPCQWGECLSFNGRSYSLKPLDAPHAEPSLESLFFINALKKNKVPPQIKLSPKPPASTQEVVLEAKGLTKRFGDFVADDHVDLVLHSKEILGLLGANGAGKTTLIKMMLGLYPIDEGELELLGKKIKTPQDRLELKSKIGYMSQNFALYKDMTIFENLVYFGTMHSLPLPLIHEKIDQLSSELGFRKYLHAFAKDLPLGINQRFSLAAAIMHEPVLLFLDEPTSGVDTIARAQFWNLLRQLKEEWGIAILITTHYMSEAQYCDRVAVLKSGKKIADATPSELFKRFPEAKDFEEVFLQLYRSVA